MKYGIDVEYIATISAIIMQSIDLLFLPLGDIDTTLNWIPLFLFVYKKIPSLLDSRFSVKFFTRNDIKLPIIAFSLLMLYPLISLNESILNVFLPSFLTRYRLISDLGSSLIFVFLILFASFLYFSWRLTDYKLPPLVEDFRKAHPAYKIQKIFASSPEDFENYIELLKRRRLYRALFLYFFSGVLPGVICVLVMVFYTIPLLGGGAMLVFLLSWLTWDLLSTRKLGKSRLIKLSDSLDRILGYDSSLRLGLTSVEGVASFILFVAFMFPNLLMFSISDNLLQLLFSAFIFVNWYTSIIAIQIARRISLRSFRKAKDGKIPTLPPFSDAIIVLISLHQWVLGLNSDKETTYPLIVLFAIILNILGVISIFIFSKRKKSIGIEKEMLIRDRLRLGFMAISLHAMFAIMVKNISMIGFVISSVLLSFFDIVRQQVRRIPKLQRVILTCTYGWVSATVPLYIVIIAIPELGKIIEALYILLTAVVFLAGIFEYHETK